MRTAKIADIDPRIFLPVFLANYSVIYLIISQLKDLPGNIETFLAFDPFVSREKN